MLTVSKSNEPRVEGGIRESSTCSEPLLIVIHHHSALERNKAPEVLPLSVIMSLTWCASRGFSLCTIESRMNRVSGS